MTPMKKPLFAFVLATASVWALAAEPSDASVEKLLVLSNAQAVTDSAFANLEANIQRGVQQANAGKTVTEAQQRVLDDVTKKAAQIIREELNWATLKPMFVQIYKENFSQEDIDGLNDFYNSQAGRAYVAKMPLVMQKTMVIVQDRVGPVMQKTAALTKTAFEQAKLEK